LLKFCQDATLVPTRPEVCELAIREFEANARRHEAAAEQECGGDLVEWCLEVREHSPGKRPRIHSQGGFADRQYDKRNRRIEPTAESGGHVHPAHELSFVA
jgi:hypothetical protein